MDKARWKRGFRGSAKLDAQVALDEMNKIRKKNGGELAPEYVVEAAKAKRSKLHTFFEWDDGLAASKFRLSQAGLLMRSVEVEKSELPGASTRALELVRSKKVPKQMVYKPIEEVMKDPEDRAELLKRALSELLATRRKFSILQELSIVFREIDHVLENMRP